jgi:hypothetical protein
MTIVNFRFKNLKREQQLMQKKKVPEGEEEAIWKAGETVM